MHINFRLSSKVLFLKFKLANFFFYFFKATQLKQIFKQTNKQTNKQTTTFRKKSKGSKKLRENKARDIWRVTWRFT